MPSNLPERAAALYVAMTPAQREAICNGCGPGHWKYKGHTWRWRLLAIPTPGAQALCEAHDVAYWIGGTEDDRRAADQDLRSSMLALAEERWFGARWLLEGEAWSFYWWLQESGEAYFRHGSPRTAANLPQVLP